LEPFFFVSQRLPTAIFFSLFLFVPLCLSFSFSFFCAMLTSEPRETTTVVPTKLLPPLPLPPKL
jgi:hypothetical protein